jgi:hypothetical protein
VGYLRWHEIWDYDLLVGALRDNFIQLCVAGSLSLFWDNLIPLCVAGNLDDLLLLALRVT